MIHIARAATFVAAFVVAAGARADSGWLYAVQPGAMVQSSPPRIELSWKTDDWPVTGYTVSRKRVADRTWGEPVSVPIDTPRFVDENVAPGNVYEYRIVRSGPFYTGYGYIAVGLDAPLVDQRGKVVLVVDRSVAAPLDTGLKQLELDLAGDGWTVIRHDVARDDSPANVRAQIKAEYDADPAGVKAVFLFGHVPIAFSGYTNPDGHDKRALAADVFYGDIDGEWTDANGDGIYDQDVIPSDVELEVGRVDFADLPGTYGTTRPYPTELELLRRYLAKDHAYRQTILRPTPRALIGGIDDADGQAYAASGYRNFAALVGADQISLAPTAGETPDAERWINWITKDDYLWAFGFGSGADWAINRLGTHPPYGGLWATDFVDLKPKGTFYLLFGSWFVDWSKPDNLLRTILAADTYGLAAAWTGRPHLFFHHMGVGETLGYGIRLSQNNDGRLYQNQVQHWLRGIHIALLGDPTLRMNMIAPPTEATASVADGNVILTWKPSADAVLGYHVYRGNDASGPFTRLTENPIGETRFVDAGRAGASAIYLVRAIARHTTPSGTYFDASQGAFAPFVSDAAPVASGASIADEVVWVDDAIPAGAFAQSTPNDRWNWIDANPKPFSGLLAHQAEIAPGIHHHFFTLTTQPMPVNAGDTLFAYAYLDPEHPPRTVMLTWQTAESWEHRAYWGEDLTVEGANDTASRRYMGPLPPVGQWVRLEVPANLVDMENHDAIGMGYTLVDGRATWDRAGKLPARH